MSAAIDLGPRAAVHLLARLGYGPRPGEVSAVLQQGLEKWAEQQLAPSPDPELEARLQRLPTLSLSLSQALAQGNADPRFYGRLYADLAASKLIRAVHGRNQLQELLTDFWFNHFNVFVFDGFLRAATHAYEREAIRPHALGRFRDLLGATAEHPAMLYYLDNYLSTVPRRQGTRLVGGLNENYGRELLELHTLGVDAGYSQLDVIDAARCFTGWGLDLRGGGAFVFRAELHDREAKSVFGLTLPAGGGKQDGDRLLDHLARHPATARHVSYRLAQRLLSDTPPAALVERCAQAFLDSDGEIAAVVRALLGSAEFWAEAFGPGKPRTALEYLAGALRAVEAEIGSARAAVDAVEAMGMPLYACAPPIGYSNAGGAWLNPSLQLARMNFGLAAAAGDVAGVAVDLSGLGSDAPSAAATFSRDILGGRVAGSTLQAAGQVTSGGRPSAAARAVGLLLASPDFQVR
jgi:uncharacterized protein (DUF1800 family)